MSLNAGVAFVVYQGCRVRRSRMSAGWWPWAVYQSTTMVDGQAEGDGAFDRAPCAVAGLADAGVAAHVLEDRFDRPARAVPFGQVVGGAVQVGGDQGEVVGLGRVQVADHDGADREVLEGSVPQALQAGDPRELGASVVLHDRQ